MFSGKKAVQSIMKHTGLDREIANRPAGKRSVAVAKRGRSVGRSYGNHRSTCIGNHKGFKKDAR